MTDDDYVLVIPFQVSDDEYSVMIVLQDHNLARIHEYDPVEMPMNAVPRSFAGRLKDVVVTYATEDEALEVERLARQGEMRDALRMITRGYRYRPDRGDGGPSFRLDPGE